MSPRKKKYYYYDSVLTEEDKNTIYRCKKELDQIYSRAHEKTLILKKQQKNERSKESRRKKRELELHKKQERIHKIEDFPKYLEKIKKTYLEIIFNKNKNDQKFLQEIKELEPHCIHPKVFETTKQVKEYCDSGGGQGPDKVSISTVSACGLCRAKVHSSEFYDYTIESGRFLEIVKELNEWKQC
jgi:hypothetical protein